MTTHVTYDARSGRIIGVHYGATDINLLRQSAHRRAKVPSEHVDVLQVPSGAAGKGKRYKVDTSRKTLVEASQGEGVGFAFGVTGNFRRKS